MSDRNDFSFLEIVRLFTILIVIYLLLAWLSDIIVFVLMLILWIGSIFVTCLLMENAFDTKETSDIWVTPVGSIFGGVFLWYCLTGIFGINKFGLFETIITNVVVTCLIALVYVRWKILKSNGK